MLILSEEERALKLAFSVLQRLRVDYPYLQAKTEPAKVDPKSEPKGEPKAVLDKVAPVAPKPATKIPRLRF